MTLHWETYPAREILHEPNVRGTLKIAKDVYSPQLENRRDILVHLPPSYDYSSKHYPVIYMQDGQNLFDHGTSFAGVDWAVDETMTALANDGIEAIIVGIPHMGERRVNEYNPFAEVWQGAGEPYVRFLTETIKPAIDRDFRTMPDRAHTGILGSSMGALISLYAFFHTDVFGMVGAMSPALWIGGGRIYYDIIDQPFKHGRVYLDNGTRESSARKLNELLIRKGYQRGVDLKYVVEHDAEHTESAWARRLPDALRFLLG